MLVLDRQSYTVSLLFIAFLDELGLSTHLQAKIKLFYIIPSCICPSSLA